MVSRETFKETSSCWPAVSKRACQQSKTNFCSKKKGSTLQNPQLEETFQFQWYFQGPLIMVRGPTFFSPGFFDTNSMKKTPPIATSIFRVVKVCSQEAGLLKSTVQPGVLEVLMISKSGWSFLGNWGNEAIYTWNPTDPFFEGVDLQFYGSNLPNYGSFGF